MYIPLFNKTNYNLLSSLLKIDELVQFAKEKNLTSISITDTNMFGTMEFIKKCEKYNIKPVIGLELLLEEYKVIVFCKDYLGYQSLIKLSTIQNERKITIDDLYKYNKNIIAVLPFNYKDKVNEIEKIYKDLYIGYENLQEEKELLLDRKNIVFFRESLYLNLDDEYILPYLYRIRDGKTIYDNITYDTKNHELNIMNLVRILQE